MLTLLTAVTQPLLTCLKTLRTFPDWCGRFVNDADNRRSFRTQQGNTCVHFLADLGDWRHSLPFEDVHWHSLIMVTCLWTYGDKSWHGTNRQIGKIGFCRKWPWNSWLWLRTVEQGQCWKSWIEFKLIKIQQLKTVKTLQVCMPVNFQLVGREGLHTCEFCFLSFAIEKGFCWNTLRWEKLKWFQPLSCIPGTSWSFPHLGKCSNVHIPTKWSFKFFFSHFHTMFSHFSKPWTLKWRQMKATTLEWAICNSEMVWFVIAV